MVKKKQRRKTHLLNHSLLHIEEDVQWCIILVTIKLHYNINFITIISFHFLFSLFQGTQKSDNIENLGITIYNVVSTMIWPRFNELHYGWKSHNFFHDIEIQQKQDNEISFASFELCSWLNHVVKIKDSSQYNSLSVILWSLEPQMSALRCSSGALFAAKLTEFTVAKW